MSKTQNQYNSGKSDGANNKGQPAPSSFKNDAERKAYQAGHAHGKKK